MQIHKRVYMYVFVCVGVYFVYKKGTLVLYYVFIRPKRISSWCFNFARVVKHFHYALDINLISVFDARSLIETIDQLLCLSR